MTVNEPERLTVSVEEAAIRLGIGRALAYQLARLGELPSLRLGRRLLVSREGLERMVASAPHSAARSDGE